MAKKNKKKRSMTAGTRAGAQQSKTGVNYLTLPKGFKLFKEESGKIYKLNFMPYVPKDVSIHADKQFIEDMWWKLPYKKHVNVGPDKADIICPRTFGQKCKICEDRQKIYNDPNGDEEVARLLKPKDRVLYIVVPLKNKDYEEIPHIWDVSYHNFQKQLDREFDFDDELECPANIDDGDTVIARFVEEQLGKNKFPKVDNIKFKARDPYDDDIAEEMPDLMDCLVKLSKKQIDAIYKGIDDVSGYDEKEPEDDEEDFDEDSDESIDNMDKDELIDFADENDIKLTKKQKKLSKKKLREYIESQLENDEDDYDEDDEDDEPFEPDSDEDDEEEDEDEEDEDEEDEDEEDEDEALTSDDINEMDKKELNALVKEKKLKIKAKDKKKIKDYRNAVISELDLSEDEEDEEDSNGCPHGYEFGEDNGDYDECSDCDKYEDCLDAME